MQTLIKKILILCVVSMPVLLTGCTAKDTYYDLYSELELSSKEAKTLVENFDPANFDVCELLETSTWYGSGDMMICKDEATSDNRVLNICIFGGIIWKDGRKYCADPFDEYFDAAREFKQRNDIRMINQLEDTDMENDPTQPYLVYLFGAFKSEEDIFAFEKEYGVSDKNNYHTAICTGLCSVKDVLALFDIESSDETLVDDAYNSAKNFEGCAAVNNGLKIKFIEDETMSGFKINMYLIKPEY